MKYKIKRRIIVDEKMADAILSFLKGDLTTRALGKIIGYSVQGTINFVNSICRQWVQEGHLIFYTTGKAGNYKMKPKK